MREELKETSQRGQVYARKASVKIGQRQGNISGVMIMKEKTFTKQEVKAMLSSVLDTTTPPFKTRMIYTLWVPIEVVARMTITSGVNLAFLHEKATLPPFLSIIMLLWTFKPLFPMLKNAYYILKEFKEKDKIEPER